MLAGWQETHNGGAKVIFWLPDASDLEVFRGLTVRKGNTAGQRFMAVLVEVGDDERPKENPTAAAMPTTEALDGVGAEASGLPTAGPKGGPLSRDAAAICRNP